MKHKFNITIVIEIFGCDSYMILPISKSEWYRVFFTSINDIFEELIQKINEENNINYSNIEEIRDYIKYITTRIGPYNFLPDVTEENIKQFKIKNYCKIKDANDYFESIGLDLRYNFKNAKTIKNYEEEENYEDIIENIIEENIIQSDVKTYLMKDKSNNFYKIGKSINPKYREHTLQSEKPTIEIVKIWDKNIEKKLHNLYNDYRIRGEWFNLNKVQVKYICTNF
jgi:hypothetical protein